MSTSPLETLARALWPADDTLAEHVLLASVQPADHVEKNRRELRQDLDVDVEQPLSSLLVDLDEALGKHGLALRTIYIGTDSYPLVCLEAAHVDALTNLAAAAGVTLLVPELEDVES